MLRVMQKLRTHLFDRHEPAVEVLERALRAARGLANARLRLRALDVVGPGARCFGRLRVENAGAIEAGARLALESRYGAVSLVTAPRGRISLGDDVIVNYGTSIRSEHAVVLGSRVLVGQFCVLEDEDEPGSGSGAPIVIEDDVWLAARVVVRPGARIGAGAVVAAGSVVEGVLPPGAIASGAPARVLRVRDRDRAAPMSAPPPVSAPRVVA